MADVVQADRKEPLKIAAGNLDSLAIRLVGGSYMPTMRPEEEKAFKTVVSMLVDPKKMGGEDGRVSPKDINKLAEYIARTDPEVLGKIHQTIYQRAHQQAEGHVVDLGILDLFGIVEGISRSIAYSVADDKVQENYGQYQQRGIQEATKEIAKVMQSSFEKAGLEVKSTAGDNAERQITRKEVEEFLKCAQVIEHYFKRSTGYQHRTYEEHNLSSIGLPSDPRKVDLLKERLPALSSDLEKLQNKNSDVVDNKITLAAVPENTKYRYATDNEMFQAGLGLDKIKDLRREYQIYINPQDSSIIRKSLSDGTFQKYSGRSIDYYGNVHGGTWQQLGDYQTVMAAERVDLRARWLSGSGISEMKGASPITLEKEYNVSGSKVEKFVGKVSGIEGVKMYRQTYANGAVTVGVEDKTTSTGWRIAEVKEQVALKNYDDLMRIAGERQISERVGIASANDLESLGLSKALLANNDFYIIKDEAGISQKIAYFSRRDGTSGVSSIVNGKSSNNWTSAFRNLGSEMQSALSVKQTEVARNFNAMPLDLEDEKVKVLLSGWAKGAVSPTEKTTYYSGPNGEIILKYEKDGNTFVYTHTGEVTEQGALTKAGFRHQPGRAGYAFNDEPRILAPVAAKSLL